MLSRLGPRYLCEIHIVLPRNMPLFECHDIGESLERKVRVWAILFLESLQSSSVPSNTIFSLLLSLYRWRKWMTWRGASCILITSGRIHPRGGREVNGNGVLFEDMSTTACLKTKTTATQFLFSRIHKINTFIYFGQHSLSEPTRARTWSCIPYTTLR